MFIKTFLRTAVALAVVTSLLSQSAFGQDQWINNFGGFYHSPFNWQDTTPPGPTETATFGMNDTYNVYWNDTTGNTFSTSVFVPAGNVTFQGYSANSTYTLSDDLELSGGNLTLGATDDPLDMIIGDALRVRNGSQLNVLHRSEVDLAGQLLIGSLAGDGTVVVGEGSTLINTSTNPAIVGSFGNSGTLKLDGNGRNNEAIVSIHADLNVANSSTTGAWGLVDIIDWGNLTIDGDLKLVSGSGNNLYGEFNVGDDSHVIVNGNLKIGGGTGASLCAFLQLTGMRSSFIQNGLGSIDIGGLDDGSNLTQVNLVRGTFRSGTGPITIRPQGVVFVGSDGNCTANGPVAIEDDGILIVDGNFNATAGLDNTADGTIDIRRGELTISGGHFEEDTPSFTVSGDFDDDRPKLAFTSGATGNIRSLIVGRYGTRGELEVVGGATLSLENFAFLGSDDESIARVTVSDAESHLILDRGVLGASGGLGILRVENGATVTWNDVTIGGSNAGRGNVSVIGTGSVLESTQALNVGNGGIGTLYLDDGGAVQVSDLQISPFTAGDGLVLVYSNSTLSANSDIYVAGNATAATGGDGELLMRGGQAEIGGTLKIWDTGEVTMFEQDGFSPFLQAGVIDNSTGGTFDFQTGTLDVDSFFGNLVNQAGILAPGPDAGPTAISGNYTQLSGATLEMEIGGTTPGGTHDVVTVSGLANLDGELHLTLIDGFLPDAADEFTLLSATSLTGFFDNIFTGQRLDVTGGQGSFVVNYGVGSAFPINQIVLSDFQSNGPIFVTPDSFMVTRGQYVSGDETSLADSDNADLSLRRLGSDIQSRTEFEVKSTSPFATPVSFVFTLEGAVFARSNVVQTIELYDYVAAAWVLVDTRNAVRAPAPDSVVTVSATGNLSRFVEAGTRCIEARVRYRSDNPRQTFASNTDRTAWTIE